MMLAAPVSSIDEGFCVIEVIFDDNEKPVDYRFLDINTSFEILTGLSRNDLIGRTVRQVMPNTEEYWIKEYGEVAATGIGNRGQ